MSSKAILGSVIIIWILYEAVMAVLLRETFSWRDWLALSHKLVYLSLLLEAVTRSGREGSAILYAMYASPLMATAVRATQGWLAYTLFTVALPIIGVAASILAYKLGIGNSRLALAVNVSSLILYTYTLIGRLYIQPETVQPEAVIGLATIYPISAILLARAPVPWYWKLVVVLPLLALLGY